MRNCFFNLSSVSSTSVRTLVLYYTLNTELFLLYGSVYHETRVCSLIHSYTPPERISIDVGDEGAQFSIPCLLFVFPSSSVWSNTN